MNADPTPQDHATPFTDGDRIEMERYILQGLASEWACAVAGLPRKYQVRMVRPGFELRDLTHCWGLWEPGKRNLALRRSLVWEYSWLCAREVLRHEMAHQMVTDVFGEDPAGHGPRFQEACRWLGADPRASGTFPSIHERLRQASVEEDDRILSRVQKLLALAQSANRHEAEVAMAKAHECIARHNLDRLAAPAERLYCSVCVGAPALSHAVEEYALATLLREYYFVETVWVPAYVLHRGKMGKILELSGTEANARMAEYVHEFLHRTILDQWRLFQGHRRLHRHRRTDFALGLLSGFRERLEAQTKGLEANHGPAGALIRCGDPHLEKYLRERFPRLRKFGRGGRQLDEAIHRAGQAAGRKTVLAKPIDLRSSAGGRLLGPRL